MEQPAYESKVLDHLGLVAAMYDELEIGETVDQHIAQDAEQRRVSIGQAVKAMVLNGLGFVNQRLYLVPAFFDTKPTDRLIGPDVRPEHLNDDALGRALDSLYEAGVTELFQSVAAHAASQLGLVSRMVHLDATSFHVDGRYNSEGEPEEGIIHIRRGYSRDHRPELNQVVLNLIVEHQAGLPLLMEPLSGNASDQASFPRLIKAHLAQLQQAEGAHYLVADSALFSARHLQELDRSGTRFITRVPETLSEAKQVLAAARPETMRPLAPGYQAMRYQSEYGGVEQRWLIIHSDAAEERARKSTTPQLERQHEQEQQAFRGVEEQVFACRADAERALASFAETLMASTAERVQILECTRVRLGGAAETGEPESFRIQGALTPSFEQEAEMVWRKSLFIVATSELSEEALSDEEVLAGYKGQHQVERGFRFLKDPAFLASSLYLKNESRIMALLMVMTLCLLVYAALQWRIREGLAREEKAIPDQKGKPTGRPTARWVFYSFEGIHVLHAEGQQLILNLKERHQIILSVLGAAYQSKYQSHSP